jgi:hypothetical protein
MLAAEFRAAVSPVIASPVLRRLLPAFAVSAVGDGMSAVGVAVAAYTLPGAAGAALRAVTLSVIALLYAFGALRAGWYLALLAASSLLHAWGLSGQYTLSPR